MPKRGENIYHRADGRWEGRYIKEYSDNGKAQYGYIYAKTYTEVKQQLTAARSQIILGTAVEPEVNTPALAEWIDKWLYRLQPTVKKSTLSKYTYITGHYVIPSLGAIRICDINNNILNDFVYNKLADGLSPKTVKDILGVVTSSLKAAKREGYFVNNFDILVPKVNNGDVKILSIIERNKLESYIIANPTPKNIGVLICLFTGIRIGELTALKWGDICFSEKLLFVNKTLQRIQCIGDKSKTEIVIDTPKSASSMRNIPLPDCIIPLLQKIKAESGQNDYILTGRENFIEPRSYQYFFYSLLKKCDIKHIKFHALRSTFATRCIEAGFDTKCLSQILGHSTVAITLNTYVFSSLEQKRANMGKLQLL